MTNAEPIKPSLIDTLLGPRPFDSYSAKARSRALVYFILFTVPLWISHVFLLTFVGHTSMFFAYLGLPGCAAILVGIRRRFNIHLLGLLYGILIDAFFVVLILRTGSIVSHFGLLFVPLVVVLISGRRLGLFMLVATLVFGAYYVLFGASSETPFGSGGTQYQVIEIVAYIFFLLLSYASGCTLEQLAIDLRRAYAKERETAVLEGSARKEKELQLQAVLSAIPIPFFLRDAQYRYVLCSDAYYEITGLKSEQVIGRTPGEIYPPKLAALFKENDEQMANSNTFQCYSLAVPWKDRYEKEITIMKMPILDETGKLVGSTGVFVDEPERIEKERRLEKLLDSNRQALSLLGHDLRNPIGSFRLLVHSMGEDAEIDARETRELLFELEKSLDSLYGLLEDLLEWAKADSILDQFHPRYMQVESIISRVLALTDNQAKNKGIRIETRLGAETQVFADERMLEALLRNLIGNAVKFTPKGGSVVVSAEKATGDRGIYLSVTDTGIGMSAAEIRSIYASEDVKHRLGTDGESGTGLGLSLCRRIVECHGGTLELVSSEGRGSTFMIFLPSDPGARDH